MLRWLTFSAVALGLVWFVYLQESFTPSAPVHEATNSAARPVAQVATNLGHAAITNRVSVETPADDDAIPVVVDDQVALARFELERAKAMQALAVHAATFRRAFDTETRDAFWANDEEPTLRKMLEAEEFSTQDVAEVVCRRTVCQITFEEPRLAEGRLLALQARLGEHYGDMQTTHSEQHAQLYVLRQDYTLEAPGGD